MIAIHWGWIAALIMVMLFLCYLLFTFWRAWRTVRNHYLTAMAQAEAGQSTAREFVDCARLIAIHRNGRINHFTFSRSGITFTIETMGLLADDIGSWRRMAGLDRE